MKKLISLIIIAITFVLTASMYVKTAEIEEIQEPIVNNNIGLMDVTVDEGI